MRDDSDQAFANGAERSGNQGGFGPVIFQSANDQFEGATAQALRSKSGADAFAGFESGSGSMVGLLAGFAGGSLPQPPGG